MRRIIIVEIGAYEGFRVPKQQCTLILEVHFRKTAAVNAGQLHMVIAYLLF